MNNNSQLDFSTKVAPNASTIRHSLHVKPPKACVHELYSPTKAVLRHALVSHSMISVLTRNASCQKHDTSITTSRNLPPRPQERMATPTAARACERGSGRAQLPQRAMKLPQRLSLTSTSVPSTRHQPHSQHPPSDNPEPREHTDDGDSPGGRFGGGTE